MTSRCHFVARSRLARKSTMFHDGAGVAHPQALRLTPAQGGCRRHIVTLSGPPECACGAPAVRERRQVDRGAARTDAGGLVKVRHRVVVRSGQPCRDVGRKKTGATPSCSNSRTNRICVHRARCRLRRRTEIAEFDRGSLGAPRPPAASSQRNRSCSSPFPTRVVRRLTDGST